MFVFKMKRSLNFRKFAVKCDNKWICIKGKCNELKEEKKRQKIKENMKKSRRIRSGEKVLDEKERKGAEK